MHSRPPAICLVLLPCLNVREDVDDGAAMAPGSSSSSSSSSSRGSNSEMTMSVDQSLTSIYGLATIPEEPELLLASTAPSSSSSTTGTGSSRAQQRKGKGISTVISGAPFSAMAQSYVRLMNGLASMGNLADLAPPALPSAFS